MNRKVLYPFLFILLMMVILGACVPGIPDLPSRSDMPIRGDLVVAYTITQPAGSERVSNVAVTRGTGDTGVPPFALVQTEFDAQQGLKSQNVMIGTEQVLGMTKPERGIGWTRFATYEPAAICMHDVAGNAQCGVKVRIKFMQNAVQHIEGEEWDYDALLYYVVDDVFWHGGNDYEYYPEENSRLISVTLNQVTQFRLGFGPSWWHNWGHSVVIVGGEPTRLEYGFWRQTEELPGAYADIHDAVHMLSAMARDLGTSYDPWLEFNPNGKFSTSTVIYSSGDADRYATAERIFLNRQKQYVVFYRPDATVAWDWVTIVPSYNFEFNDFRQYFSENVLKSIIDENGELRKGQGKSTVIREMEKIGCQNCPNPALEQVSFFSSSGELLYSITFRAFVGANDTLVIYGPNKPTKWNFPNAPATPDYKRPVDYIINDNGSRTEVDQDKQTFPDENAWRDYLAEATIWEWLRQENPLDADLFIQFRVNDSSEWAPIPCSDGGICGYKPVRWNLEANYFFDGEIEKASQIEQLFGEVGMRTLGFSYVSGRYEGAGLDFAQDQILFREWYYEGFPNQEAVFMFDARALTTPQMLAKSWAALHEGQTAVETELSAGN